MIEKIKTYLKKFGIIKSQKYYLSEQEDRGMAIDFLNKYPLTGNVVEMKNIIDNYPHIATDQYKNFAMKLALETGQVETIAFLINYVDIVNNGFFHFSFYVDDDFSNYLNWNKSLKWLYFNKKDFLMKAYSYNDDEPYSEIGGKVSKVRQIIDFLEVMKVKEALNEGVPLKGKSGMATVTKI